MCLSCIPRGSANWRHISACEEQHAAKLQGSPLNNMRLTGFFEPTAIRINRDTNVHRVHFCASRLRFASLAMVGHGLNNPGNGQRLGKMDLRQHALVRKWQGNSASGRPSETLQSALESTERDDDSSIEESMSMMSGTDVYNKEDKVRVFGANMDSKFASRGAGLQNYEEKKIPAAVMEELLFQHGGDMEAAKKELRTRDIKSKEAEAHFRAGVALMERGKYKGAIEEIGKAIIAVPGGAGSREGGQYSIWLGQAFDANGERGKAVKTMRALKTHDDRDVRRVASGIEFVLTSPDLKLSKNSFQSFDIEKLDEIKAGKKALEYKVMEKPPEKYSLEWYMLQPPPPAEGATGRAGNVGLLLAVTAATALFVLTSASGI